MVGEGDEGLGLGPRAYGGDGRMEKGVKIGQKSCSRKMTLDIGHKKKSNHI